MLELALGLLLIAVIAAVFGFGGIAGAFAGASKFVFVIFLVLAVAALLF